MEADLILANDSSPEDSIQDCPTTTVPAPIWPPDKTNDDLKVVEKDLNYVSQISFDTSEDKQVNINRNGTFVRSIQFNKSNKISPFLKHHQRIPHMLESQLSPIGEVPNDSKFEDSIVTESLLQLTSFNSKANLENEAHEDINDDENEDQLKEDMDKVIAELTQAVMKSKNVTTLTRAMNKNSSSLSRSTSDRLRSSLKLLKKARGIDAVKDLWQQSGMKTNGRKLLTDSLSEEDEKSNHYFNRKQPKRLKTTSKKHETLTAKLSSSSSAGSEETSPPYRQVLNPRKRSSISLTSSTELYAEVYRTSSGESSNSPM